MSVPSYSFELRPRRREAAFFRVLFFTYPQLVGRYLFRRRPTVETILYLLFSPLFVVRNLANGILCTFPFCPDINYRLTLHDSHLSFGPDIDRAQKANSYGSIKTMFRADNQWCALLHDGHIVYLPPDEAGHLTAGTLKHKQAAQSGAPPNSQPPLPLPPSPAVQSSDPLRTPSSGGCG